MFYPVLMFDSGKKEFDKFYDAWFVYLSLSNFRIPLLNSGPEPIAFGLHHSHCFGEYSKIELLRSCAEALAEALRTLVNSEFSITFASQLVGEWEWSAYKRSRAVDRAFIFLAEHARVMAFF
jgi:hypothetical protein